MDASEKKILEKRLENWGAWAQEGKPRGKSPLLGIMREAGYKPEYGEPERPRIIDIRDAIEIEAAWSVMPESREKRILQEVYGNPKRPLWISCKRSGFRIRGYEYHMSRAMNLLHLILCRGKIPLSD